MIGKAVEREVWPLIEQGRIKPIVDSVFPFGKAARGPGENGRKQPYRENPAYPLSVCRFPAFFSRGKRLYSRLNPFIVVSVSGLAVIPLAP